jgi:hypothetical protein
METYQRSGKIPTLGAMLVLIIGSLVAAITAVIYTYATIYIPIIYLNVVITLGFGFLVGYGVGKAAKFGKVRNVGFVIVMAVFCGLIGIYMEWVTTLYAFLGDDIGLHAFSPLAIWFMVQFLYTEGSWGMTGNANVTGVFLAIIWVIEIGMIMVPAVLTAISVGGLQPFCEACSRWTTTEKGIKRLQPGGGDDMWDKVLAGDLIPLDALVRASGQEQTHIRFDLASCPECAGSDYLTIQVVQKSLDNKGNVTEKETALGEHLWVTREHVEFIRGCGQSEPLPSAAEPIEDVDKFAGIDNHDDDAQPEDFNFTGE